MPCDAIARQLDRLRQACDQLDQLRIMEVCGTHTVSLFRSGVKSLLPEAVQLISGPGCPVCVTSQGYFDAAFDISQAGDDVILCTYGDMLRVPGRSGSLETLRAAGRAVRVVYSARDALALARREPSRRVVFLAVGFETTAPTTAATVLDAQAGDVGNFFILPAHKTIIPAMLALLAGGRIGIDAFLCPGHVSVVLGSEAYRPIVERHGKPCVVAGFEPAGMLAAIARLAELVADGQAEIDNAYPAAVTARGNPVARELVEQVFTPGPGTWRAMGEIAESGLELRESFGRFDAREEFDVAFGPDKHPPGCRCGEVIQGLCSPADCSLFGRGCSPTHPVGPCMVSSEGTCAAWHKYGR